MVECYHNQKNIYRSSQEGLLLSSNFNRKGFDKTRWYTIDYKVLMSLPLYQNDTTEESKRADGEVKMRQPIPKTNTKTTTKINCYHNSNNGNRKRVSKFKPHGKYEHLVNS